ncbi:MAG: hypothetical protein K2P66_00805 [Lachnospiraceae bacterium]|nr:hypothetical protein [Lachnospiraceae bacterium]
MTLTRDEYLFLIVVIVNTIVAFLYLLIGILIVVPIRNREREDEAERLHDNRRTYLLRFIVMVLCPIVGPLFFFVVHLFYLTIFRFQVELDDVVFSKERVRTQLKADEERERNVIPLEEAIAVNDQKSLRTAMLNVLKGEIQDSLAAIAMALETKDSESSHYAASILSHELSEFRMEAQKLYLGIRAEEDGQTEYEDMMIDYTDNVLRQKVFTELEQRRFVRMMTEAAESFYTKNPSGMTEKQYESVCLRLLDIGDFENSEKWCERLAGQYPDRLSAFTCKLKLYFIVRNKEAFFRTLDALKHSDVVIDNETLELIRIFS